METAAPPSLTLAPEGDGEEARLQAVHELALLDTGPEDRFDRVTRFAQRLFGVPVALITLLDRDRAWFKSHPGLDTDEAARTEAFCAVTIRQPDTLVVEDLHLDPRFRDNPLVTGDQAFRFYAGHPLEAPGGQRVGTLCLLDQQPRDLSERERDMLRDLASWVQRELALRDEMEGANRIQQALLPGRPPSVPRWDIAGSCVPARGVGGDFYDWHPVGDEVALTVADVMGKGMGAAILAATVRAVMRAVAGDDGPAPAVTRAADALAADLAGTATFVTLFHARLDPALDVLRFVDAGHGLGVLVRADGSVERLAGDGLPLGVLPGDTWAASSVRCGPGDTLLVCSDGVLDLFGGELVGLDRLAALVRVTSSAGPLVDRISALAARTPLLDDVTVVAARRIAD